MTKLLTASEYAKAAGISRTRLGQFLAAGRVPGARRIGTGYGGRGLWLIPAGAIVRRKRQGWKGRGRLDTV